MVAINEQIDLNKLSWFIVVSGHINYKVALIDSINKTSKSGDGK